MDRAKARFAAPASGPLAADEPAHPQGQCGSDQQEQAAGQEQAEDRPEQRTQPALHAPGHQQQAGEQGERRDQTQPQAEAQAEGLPFELATLEFEQVEQRQQPFGDVVQRRPPRSSSLAMTKPTPKAVSRLLSGCSPTRPSS